MPDRLAKKKDTDKVKDPTQDSLEALNKNYPYNLRFLVQNHFDEIFHQPNSSNVGIWQTDLDKERVTFRNKVIRAVADSKDPLLNMLVMEGLSWRLTQDLDTLLYIDTHQGQWPSNPLLDGTIRKNSRVLGGQ
jgi:hypothetical protein